MYPGPPMYQWHCYLNKRAIFICGRLKKKIVLNRREIIFSVPGWTVDYFSYWGPVNNKSVFNGVETGAICHSPGQNQTRWVKRKPRRVGASPPYHQAGQCTAQL